MAAEYDRLIHRLRAYAAEGHSAPEVLRWLRRELVVLQGENLSTYTFIYCLHEAFDMDLQVVLRVQAWKEMGWGGTMSTDALEALFGRLVPRNGEVNESY